MQQRQVLHIRTHDRPGEDRSWRLADGCMARGSLLADGKMDSILTVSSGNKAGVCEVLLCSLCGESGDAAAVPQCHFLYKTKGWMHHC